MKAEITPYPPPTKIKQQHDTCPCFFATSPKLPNSLYHDIIKTFSKNKTKKTS